jgi:GDPmannose 4,6-dehydratase
MNPPRALITGITGQDGSYLADLLLSKGCEVHGLVRQPASVARLHRISHLLGRLHLHDGSLDSRDDIASVIRQVQPDECYHLAARTVVNDDEFSTLQTNIEGTHHVLSALKESIPACRVFFASSSEMFGQVTESPQSETTPFHPRSVYGLSKIAGFHLTRHYREAHGMHASSGILFNHESPRRGHEFVTRKITSTLAGIVAGRQSELRLGNLDAKRDWGFAGDYVEAMWLMLRQSVADDYVIGTGQTHSVREFLELAFGMVGLDYSKYVVVDPRFYRPAEPVSLVADPAKARRVLGWTSRMPFPDLVQQMVENDCAVRA